MVIESVWARLKIVSEDALNLAGHNKLGFEIELSNQVEHQVSHLRPVILGMKGAVRGGARWEAL
jgi:hypothetical protein